MMVDKIFNGTVNFIKNVSKHTGLTYEQVNVIGMLVIGAIVAGLTTGVIIKPKK